MSFLTPVNLLLVDGNPKSLLALEALLQSPDRNLLRARSCPEALPLLLDREFAAILLDLRTPETDGLETVLRIRAHEPQRNTPILLVVDSDEDLRHVLGGEGVGSLDCIFAPVEPAILRAKIGLWVELFRKAGELDRRARELDRCKQDLEAFTYAVSHDLGAPLHLVEGFAALLHSDCSALLDENGKRHLRAIVAAVEGMDGLLRDLLAYSRIGTRDLVPRSVPLAFVLDEVLAVLEGEIRRARGAVEVRPPLPVVMGDAGMLREVVSNLVTNGLKFVPQGVEPRLRVWSEEAGAFVRLWVSDNGIGIEAQHYERVFRVFERLHTAGRYPGRGIGLSMVRKATERMGGRVGVISQPGEGSRFWIDLLPARAEREGKAAPTARLGTPVDPAASPAEPRA
ncbi:MAG: response regulator [Planctomycetes bacterium]|nr:response regulator [Planctomycetota bacterium]